MGFLFVITGICDFSPTGDGLAGFGQSEIFPTPRQILPRGHLGRGWQWSKRRSRRSTSGLKTPQSAVRTLRGASSICAVQSRISSETALNGRPAGWWRPSLRTAMCVASQLDGSSTGDWGGAWSSNEIREFNPRVEAVTVRVPSRTGIPTVRGTSRPGEREWRPAENDGTGGVALPE